MTVLVTGAAGFLGSHVTDLLVESGERPRVLLHPSDNVSRLPDAELDIHWGDVADPIVIDAAVTGVDCVLHCAAKTGPWGPEAEYEHTNVRALETLVYAAMAAGVRRVVHVSSITVHGNDVGGVADERAPLREEPNPYSRSKLVGERVLERMIREERAPVTIVRPGWIYGPGDRASFGRLAEKIAGGHMLMVGGGDNHIPLIYVRDAARGVLLAAESSRAVGRAYLLVNDEPVTQRDFITAVAAELGVAPPTRHLPYRLALNMGAFAERLGHLARRADPPPVMRYGLQLLGGENRFLITRAREELGFRPLVDLADGVSCSVAWYRGATEAARTAKVPA
ncbi:MAG TPA: NAD-dependent epimerase/dehydratase family protein [Thermoleophilaceae bacterium]|jgi:nucleoside-diphosphate-sugar epimerase|nr:NAD-dependent epimerase/dehydratase family protein [Thermoleophilaceae bacterium]